MKKHVYLLPLLMISCFSMAFSAGSRFGPESQLTEFHELNLVLTEKIITYCHNNKLPFAKIEQYHLKNAKGSSLDYLGKILDTNAVIYKETDANCNFVTYCYKEKPQDENIIDVNYYKNMFDQINKHQQMQDKNAEMQKETIDSKVIALNEEKEFENYLLASNTKTLLIDFYSEKCPPCKTLAPYLDAYSKVNDDQYTFLKIDITKFPTLGQKYNLKNIPTLVIIKNGEEIARKIGPVEVLDYCEENLKSFEK